MKKIFIISILAILIFGCKTQQSVVQVPVQTITKVVDRIVKVPAPQDSATIMALFQCDSLHNVVLKNYNELKTSGLQSAFKSVKNGIEIRLKTVHDTIRVEAKDSLVYKEIPIIQKIPVEVEKPLGWFLWTLIISGSLGILYLLIRFLWPLIKTFIKV